MNNEHFNEHFMNAFMNTFLQEMNTMNTSHVHTLFLFNNINYNGYIDYSLNICKVVIVSINRWKVFMERFMNVFMVIS